MTTPLFLAPLLVLALFLAHPTCVSAAGEGSSSWVSSSYAFRRQVHLTVSSLTETLTDVPVLIKVTSANTAIGQSDAQGRDIVFTNEDSSKILPVDYEVFNGAGDSLMWVRVDQLYAGKPTYLWLYYDNADWNATNTALGVPASFKTWEEYISVLHFNENGAVSALNEAALSDSTATLSMIQEDNAECNCAGGTTPSDLAGAVGRARYWPNAGKYFKRTGYVYNQTGATVADTVLNVDFWFKIDSCTPDIKSGDWTILSLKDPTVSDPDDDKHLFRVSVEEDSCALRLVSGQIARNAALSAVSFSTPIPDGQWTHLAASVSKRPSTGTQQIKAFVNGKLLAIYITDIITSTANNVDVTIGGPFNLICRDNNCKKVRYYSYTMFEAALDELRVSTMKEKWTDDWAAAVYKYSKAENVVVATSKCARVSAAKTVPRVIESNVAAGTHVNITIRPVDVAGQNISSACIDSGMVYNVALTGSQTQTLQLKQADLVTDAASGVSEFRTTVFLSKAGSAQFAFTVAESRQNPTTMVNVGSDMGMQTDSVTVQPGAANKVLLSPTRLSLVTGVPETLTITVLDFYDNARTGTVDAVDLTGFPANTPVTKNVLSVGNAQYNVTLNATVNVPDTPLSVMVNGVQLTTIDFISTGGSNPNNPNNNNPNPAPTPSDSGQVAVIGGSLGGVLALVVVVGGVYISKRRYAKYQESKLPNFSKYAFMLSEKVHVPVKTVMFGNKANNELREILMENDISLAQAIVSVVPQGKLNEVLRSVMYFYHCNGQHQKNVHLVKRYVTIKLRESMAAGSSNLFRTDNEATKSMNIYMRMVGLPYLWYAVQPIIKETANVSVELDPTRVKQPTQETWQTGQSYHDQDLSRYTIMQSAQKVFVGITRSIRFMPLSIRSVASHLEQEIRMLATDEHDPDRLARIALAGMLYLRYFCPAMSAPTAFGFLEQRPDADKRRFLTLIAKTLQNLANGVKFGGKEEYMQVLNDFIDSNSNKIESYFNDVIRVNDEGGVAMSDTGSFRGEEVPEKVKADQPERALTMEVKPPAECEAWCLTVLYRVLHSDLNNILRKVRPNLRDRLKRAVAMSLPPLPPKKEWAYKGFLTKQGGSIKTWKRRFFVLSAHFLWYCSSEDDEPTNEDIKGVICLDGAQVLEWEEDGICIDHPHSRTFFLRGENVADRAKWMKAIRADIEQANEEAAARDAKKEAEEKKQKVEAAAAVGADADGGDKKGRRSIFNRRASAVEAAKQAGPAAMEMKEMDDDIKMEGEGEGEGDIDGPAAMRLSKASSQQSLLSRGAAVSQPGFEPLVAGSARSSSGGSVQGPGAGEDKGGDDDAKHDDRQEAAHGRGLSATSSLHDLEYVHEEEVVLQEEVAQLSSDWQVYHTDEGVPYYYNAKTGVTQWERPAGMRSRPPPSSVPH